MKPTEPIGNSLLKSGKLIALSIVTALCVWEAAKTYSQSKGVEAAGRHATLLQSMVSTNSRYSNLEIHPQSGLGGRIFIRGLVNSEQDLADLKKMVLKTDPPVEVVSWVHVLDPTVQQDPSPDGNWTWLHEPDTKWAQQIFEGKIPKVPTNGSDIYAIRFQHPETTFTTNVHSK